MGAVKVSHSGLDLAPHIAALGASAGPKSCATWRPSPALGAPKSGLSLEPASGPEIHPRRPPVRQREAQLRAPTKLSHHADRKIQPSDFFLGVEVLVALLPTH